MSNVSQLLKTVKYDLAVQEERRLRVHELSAVEAELAAKTAELAKYADNDPERHKDLRKSSTPHKVELLSNLDFRTPRHASHSTVTVGKHGCSLGHGSVPCLRNDWQCCRGRSSAGKGCSQPVAWCVSSPSGCPVVSSQEYSLLNSMANSHSGLLQTTLRCCASGCGNDFRGRSSNWIPSCLR